MASVRMCHWTVHRVVAARLKASAGSHRRVTGVVRSAAHIIPANCFTKHTCRTEDWELHRMTAYYVGTSCLWDANSFPHRKVSVMNSSVSILATCFWSTPSYTKEAVIILPPTLVPPHGPKRAVNNNNNNNNNNKNKVVLVHGLKSYRVSSGIALLLV
jgi:hypothetical protein